MGLENEGKVGKGLIQRVAKHLEAALETPLEAGLYIVASPIGNLLDITLRALGVLERADIILCEDTRHSRKLLSHFALEGDVRPYHDHSSPRERALILTRIAGGESVALLSDAGTPLISDPGYKLVCSAHEQGLTVVTIPGPSAPIAALSASGLACDRFFFEGFLPAKQSQRQKRLREIEAIPATLIFFESAKRLPHALRDMADIFGEQRQGALAKELTKRYEHIFKGTLEALIGELAELPLKGEFVVLISPPEEKNVSDEEIETELLCAFKGLSFRDAVSSVAEASALPRKRVYKIGLSLKDNEPLKEPDDQS